MWSSPDADESAWDAALENQSPESSDTLADVCCSHALMASKRFNEVYVGGNDTSFMLQILGADGTAKASYENRECDSTEADSLDVLVSVLKAGVNGADILYTTRGTKAMRLISSFWVFCPHAELLKADSNDKFSHLLCRLEEEDWTTAPLSLSHLRKLKTQRNDDLQNLHIFAHFEGEDTSHETRCIGDVTNMKNPLCPRPEEMILSDT